MKNSKLSCLLVALGLTVSTFFALNNVDQPFLTNDYQEKAQIIQEKKEFSFLRLILTLLAGLVLKAFALIIKLLLKLSKGPLSIIFDILVDALIIFVLLLLVTGLLFKLFFPGRSLKELYTPKNLLAMAVVSLTLSSIGHLGGYFKEYQWLQPVIMTCIELLICKYLINKLVFLLPKKLRIKLLFSIPLINLITYLLKDFAVIDSFLCISGVGCIIVITAYTIYVCYYN